MNNQKNPNNFTPRTSSNQYYKRKKKPNKDGIITLCFIALIAIIIVVLIIFLVKAISNKQPPIVTDSSTSPIVVTTATDSSTPAETTSPTVTTSPDVTTSTEPIVVPGYTSIEVDSFRVNQGSLVVVNSAHPYTANTNSKLLSLYNQDGFNTIYRLRNSHVSLQSTIIKNFVDMMKALKSNKASSLGNGDIYLVKYAAAPTDPWRVTDPDNEDITGWAIDLRIRLASGLEAPLTDDEANWVKQNAANYGFVLRYQEGKEKITGEDYDPSHLRYVGVVHAKFMNSKNLSLEEYVDYLKNNTSYNTEQAKMNNYIIYYVPVSAGASTTIYIPDGYTLDSYSGDNIGGFIVTAIKNQ